MTTLLTIPETATRLRVHKSTVYELIADRRLKAVNIARDGARSKTRVTEQALADYIDSLPAVGLAS